MSLLKINRERLKKSILEMAKIAEGAGDGKISRLALTEEDRMGRCSRRRGYPAAVYPRTCWFLKK